MSKKLMSVFALVLLAATPATAAPFCTGGDWGSGIRISGSIRIGKDDSENRDALNLMRLRRIGVDATRAEEWNGCIRAFVRQPGGGEIMQFFDPTTLEQVY